MAAQLSYVWNLLCLVMLHSTLCFWQKKTFSCKQQSCRAFFYITYLHSLMCHVSVVSPYCVCIGHISYNHTFILHVIFNGAQSCRYNVTFAMAEVNKLSELLQLEQIPLHFILSISTIMQSLRNMGTKLLNLQWTKHAVWCTKIPAYSFSVLYSMSQHEFDCSEKLFSTANKQEQGNTGCYINVLPPLLNVIYVSHTKLQTWFQSGKCPDAKI